MSDIDAHVETVREALETGKRRFTARGWEKYDCKVEVDGKTLERLLDDLARIVGQARDNDRWLAWSGGEYPDDSPGDVIAAEADGTIVLDDGITTWNPLRALAFVMATKQDSRLADALRPFAEFPPITTAQRNRGYITARIDPAWIDAARAALAEAGVTDNERTAIAGWDEDGKRTTANPVTHAERPVGTGPTAAEHARIVTRSIDYAKARTITGTPEYRDLRRADESLAALVALADVGGTEETSE